MTHLNALYWTAITLIILQVLSERYRLKRLVKAGKLSYAKMEQLMDLRCKFGILTVLVVAVIYHVFAK